MELTAHFRVMWRRRWRVIIVSILIAGAVYALSSSRPPVYRAEALLAVRSARATTGDAPSQEGTLFLARTYAELAKTRPVVSDGVRRSGLAISTGAALQRIDVNASTDVGFVSVSATGATPGAAGRLAQGLSRALTATVERQEAATLAADVTPLRDEITRIEAELGSSPDNAPRRAAVEARYTALLSSVTERELRPANGVAVISPSRAGTAPISPAPFRDALLALIAALVVNAELAVLLEAMSDRFPRENLVEEVSRVTGLPVLAEVPSGDDIGVIEAFRSLRSNLMFMDTPGVLRTVAIVSVEPGAGKSYCAIHLASSAAELDLAVVLIDGDLRRPMIHERMDMKRTPGLSEVLRGAAVDSAVVYPRAYPKLGVLPAGSPADDPAGLVGGGLLRKLFHDLSAQLVIVDTPAETLFSDAMTLALQCDVTIVVIDARSTHRRAVRRLVESLRRVNANPIGVVINRTDRLSRPSYYAKEGRGSANAFSL